MHFKLLFGVWTRLLREHGHAISPRKIGKAATITFASVCYSLLDQLQESRFRDELAQIELPRSPIFIVGHWRSGTTLLHELLCLDRRHAYASTRACMNPSEFLFDGSPQAGVVKGASIKRPMDNMTVSAESPQEDEFALFALGAPSPYEHWMFPAKLESHPEYFGWEGMSLEDVARWKSIFVKFLKRVALKNPGRLVIKSPPHSYRLKVLRETFPDAVFVRILRDPYVLFASTRHLLTRMFRLYALTEYRMEDLEEYVLANGLRMEKALAESLPDVPEGRYHVIQYEDLVAHPIEQMAGLYAKLRLGDFGAILPAIRAYLDSHNDYQVNQFELSREEEKLVSERWRDMILGQGYSLR